MEWAFIVFLILLNCYTVIELEDTKSKLNFQIKELKNEVNNLRYIIKKKG